jgi:hypothetical protein
VGNVSSEKNLRKTQNFGTDAQVVVFEHRLNVVSGNNWTVIFVMCVCVCV